MQYYDYNEFLRLSAVLNYHLSAKQTDWNNILRLILGDNVVRIHEREILLDVLYYINKVYGQKRRILGPLSVVHPIRAAALLSRNKDTSRAIPILHDL